MVLSNETVLTEQYANDRGPGQGAKTLWSWNTSSFWTFNGNHKFACFL